MQLLLEPLLVLVLLVRLVVGVLLPVWLLELPTLLLVLGLLMLETRGAADCREP